jgi:cytochrome c oxidase subunit I+III
VALGALLGGAALLCACAAMAANAAGHAAAGLQPAADAWSATVAALLGYQLLHAVLLVVLSGYLAARLAAGLVTPRSRATLDHTALLWHYAAAQGIVIALVVQGLPAVMA